MGRRRKSWRRSEVRQKLLAGEQVLSLVMVLLCFDIQTVWQQKDSIFMVMSHGFFCSKFIPNLVTVNFSDIHKSAEFRMWALMIMNKSHWYWLYFSIIYVRCYLTLSSMLYVGVAVSDFSACNLCSHWFLMGETKLWVILFWIKFKDLSSKF